MQLYVASGKIKEVAKWIKAGIRQFQADKVRRVYLVDLEVKIHFQALMRSDFKLSKYGASKRLLLKALNLTISAEEVKNTST